MGLAVVASTDQAEAFTDQALAEVTVVTVVAEAALESVSVESEFDSKASLQIQKMSGKAKSCRSLLCATDARGRRSRLPNHPFETESVANLLGSEHCKLGCLPIRNEQPRGCSLRRLRL